MAAISLLAAKELGSNRHRYLMADGIFVGTREEPQ
jgi:hypothetical protein